MQTVVRRPIVRLIAWLLLILLGLCWLAAAVPVAETGQNPPDRPKDDGWRRTIDGWEHRSSWVQHHRSDSAGLHPAVVGLLQLQLSLAALIGFSRKTSPEQSLRLRRFSRTDWPPCLHYYS